MLTSLLFLLMLQKPATEFPHVKVEELMNPQTYGAESGTAEIPHHWYDFHKDRPGTVEVKLKEDLRAPIYHVHDLTDPKADFLVVDPGYAHANHFSIKGKKGHKFQWSVAGRP